MKRIIREGTEILGQDKDLPIYKGQTKDIFLHYQRVI